MNDNKSELILMDRTMSNYPLISVGTGLALETMFMPEAGYFDPTRTIEHKLKKHEYRNVYINIYTILRNIVSAISTTEDKHSFLDNNKSASAIVSTFLEEYTEIERLLLANDFLPILYIVDYSKNKVITNTDRNIINAVNDTLSSKQNIFINKAVKYIKKEYYNSFTESLKVNILKYEPKTNKEYLNIVVNKLKLGDNKLPLIGNSKNLIISHFAIDLLNLKYLSNLTLLETHTGRLVNYKNFNKKYPELTNMDFTTVVPFVEKMYYVFGDSNLIKPVAAKYRKALYNIFIKEGVNSTTKGVAIDSVIKKNIKDLDPEFWDLYKNLTTSY